MGGVRIGVEWSICFGATPTKCHPERVLRGGRVEGPFFALAVLVVTPEWALLCPTTNRINDQALNNIEEDVEEDGSLEG